jgi:hypothetical protein
MVAGVAAAAVAAAIGGGIVPWTGLTSSPSSTPPPPPPPKPDTTTTTTTTTGGNDTPTTPPSQRQLEDTIGALLAAVSREDQPDLGAGLQLLSGLDTSDAATRAAARAVGIATAASASATNPLPILHHLFNLMPRAESHPQSHEALVALVRGLVALGADVNAAHPAGAEPSVLFKASVMREINVSLALVAAGATPARKGDDLLFARLAAVPCDMVPFSKVGRRRNRRRRQSA